MLLTAPLQPPLQVNVNGAPFVLPKPPALRLLVLPSFDSVLPVAGWEFLKYIVDPVTPSRTVPRPSIQYLPLPLPSLVRAQPTLAVHWCGSLPGTDCCAVRGLPARENVIFPSPPVIVCPGLHSLAGQGRVVTSPLASFV